MEIPHKFPFHILVLLAAGIAAMTGLMLLYCSKYKISRRKLPAVSAMIALCAYLSSKIMYLIENGKLGGLTGMSMFGAVLLLPLWFIPIARWLKVPYHDILDISSPAGFTILAIMKIGCIRSGCCGGRILYITENKEVVRFPSQWVELIAGMVLAGVILLVVRKGTWKGRIYPLSMLLYGIVRFTLNWFRKTTPFIWLLPAGNFWSLIAIAAGLIWLWYLKKHPQRKER